MMYTPGMPEEDALHARRHAKRVAEAKLDGLPLPPAAALELLPPSSPAGVRCARLRRGKAPAWAAKAMAFVDAQLQAVRASPRPVDHYQLFLVTDESKPRAVALALVERIATGYRATDASHYDLAAPRRVVAGISRMWTSPSHRRRGLMAALLSAVCTNFAAPAVLDPLTDLAFTQLTTSGFAFASAYLTALAARKAWEAELEAARRGDDGGSESGDDEADGDSRSPPAAFPLVYRIEDVPV